MDWRTKSILLLTASLLCSIAGGCATWSSESDKEPDGLRMPVRRMSPDSVVVETVLVRFPSGSEKALHDIWARVHESGFDIAHRRLLDQNGLRAGVLLGELPRAIREQLSSTSLEQSTDALEHAGLAADVDNKMRQLQCRAGRRKELIVKRPLSDPLTVLMAFEDKRLVGETYQGASLLFDLRAIPHGDGTATVQLTPEIQHGEHRQTFVSTEFGIRPEVNRQQSSWERLKLQATLSPGQILIVSTTSPPKSLGEAFFVTKTADKSHQNVLLLLRLADTQLDELFAADKVEQAHAMTER